MKAKAFTILEILVAISIVVVIASLAYPSLTEARARSRQAVCVSNLHQIYLALDIYRSDEDGEGVYGRAIDMGLPLNFSYIAHTQGLSHGIFSCMATNPLTSKNLYNIMYEPDGSYGIEDWTQYVSRVGDSAVIVADYDHELPTSLHHSPFTTHRGIGLYLDGHVSYRVRGGNWFEYDWWTPGG